jgi:hypothetical protein
VQVGNLENGEPIESGRQVIDLDRLADYVYLVIVIDCIVGYENEYYLAEDYQEEQQDF